MIKYHHTKTIIFRDYYNHVYKSMLLSSFLNKYTSILLEQNLLKLKNEVTVFLTIL